MLTSLHVFISSSVINQKKSTSILCVLHFLIDPVFSLVSARPPPQPWWLFFFLSSCLVSFEGQGLVWLCVVWRRKRGRIWLKSCLSSLRIMGFLLCYFILRFERRHQSGWCFILHTSILLMNWLNKNMLGMGGASFPYPVDANFDFSHTH